MRSRETPPGLALRARRRVPADRRAGTTENASRARILNTAGGTPLCRLGRRTRWAPPLRAERVDRDLVEQAQRGDQEAFAVLARSRGDALFGIARRILRDVSLAEDAVQQALVIAWRELPRLRDPDRFDAWFPR